MSSPWITLLLSVVSGVGLAGLVLYVRQQAVRREEAARQEAAHRMVEAARMEAEAIRKEAEAEAREILRQAKEEAKEIRRESQEIQKRLVQREEGLDRRLEQLERREEAIKNRELDLAREREEVERARAEAQSRLEEVARMSRDEAKQELIQSMVEEARHEGAKLVRQVEQAAQEEADRKAKKIISIAIERMAGEYVAERTVSVVHLPNEEMKGRIIGREGRNIRALEAATGVDIVIDETPESVVVSCHNPIRREVARMALEMLIADGRIHPSRIEEVVRKCEDALERQVREAGERAIIEVGVQGVHPELVKLLGMLKFRYSYAQNVLQHSIETAFLAGIMAAELGLNEKLARRAGLLHDIGKALTHEVEGSHAIIGGEVARKYGESAKIVNAIAAHHEEVPAETILAPLVDAADALSGARPGARRETVQSYVRRLEELERIGTSFEGVQKAFALQAGREVRVIVSPQEVDDQATSLLARQVARKIEEEMAYPGQIKVTVIREVRASDYAR